MLPWRWSTSKGTGNYRLENGGLDIHAGGKSPVAVVVIADQCITVGVDELYFEVRVSSLNVGVLMAIGMTSMDRIPCYPGYGENSYALHSVGDLYHAETNLTQNYSAPFVPNDVLGCGLKKNGAMYYTCNGKPLQTAFKLNTGEKMNVWPTIGIQPTDSSVVLISNFGSHSFLWQGDIPFLFDEVIESHKPSLRRFSSALQETLLTAAVQKSMELKTTMMEKMNSEEFHETLKLHVDSMKTQFSKSLVAMVSPRKEDEQSQKRINQISKEVESILIQLKQCLNSEDVDMGVLNSLTLQAKEARQMLITNASTAKDDQHHAFFMDQNREILVMLEKVEHFWSGFVDNEISGPSNDNCSRAVSDGGSSNAGSSQDDIYGEQYGVLQGAADNVRELVFSIRSGDENTQYNAARALTYLVCDNQRNSSTIRNLSHQDAYEAGAAGILIGVYLRKRTLQYPRLHHAIATAVVALTSGMPVNRIQLHVLAAGLEPDLPHIISCCKLLLMKPCYCCESQSWHNSQACAFTQRDAALALANLCLIFHKRDIGGTDKEMYTWIEEMCKYGIPLLTTISSSPIPRPNTTNVDEEDIDEKRRAWRESRRYASFALSIVSQYPHARQVVHESGVLSLLVKLLEKNDTEILHHTISSIHSLCCLTPPDFVVGQIRQVNLVTIGFTIAELINEGLVPQLVSIGDRMVSDPSWMSRNGRFKLIACFHALSSLSQCHKELFNKGAVDSLFALAEQVLLDDEVEAETPTTPEEPANASHRLVRRQYSRFSSSDTAGHHLNDPEGLVELRILSETVYNMVQASLKLSLVLNGHSSGKSNFASASIERNCVWVVELSRHPDASVRLHGLRSILALTQGEDEWYEKLETYGISSALINVLESYHHRKIMNHRAKDFILNEIKIDASLILGELANSSQRSCVAVAGGLGYALRTLKLLYFGGDETKASPPTKKKNGFFRMSKYPSIDEESVDDEQHHENLVEVTGNDIVVAHQCVRILSGLVEFAATPSSIETWRSIATDVFSKIERILFLAIMLLGSPASVIQIEACRVISMVISCQAATAYKVDIAVVSLDRLVQLAIGGRGGVEYPDRELQSAAGTVLVDLGFSEGVHSLQSYGKDTKELFQWFELVYSIDLQRHMNTAFMAVAIASWQLTLQDSSLAIFAQNPFHGIFPTEQSGLSIEDKGDMRLNSIPRVFSFSDISEDSTPLLKSSKIQPRWLRWVLGCASKRTRGQVYCDSDDEETSMRQFDIIGSSPIEEPLLLNQDDQEALLKRYATSKEFSNSNFSIYAHYKISSFIGTLVEVSNTDLIRPKNDSVDILQVGTKGYLASLPRTCEFEFESSFPSLLHRRHLIIPNIDSFQLLQPSFLLQRPMSIKVTDVNTVNFRLCRNLQKLLSKCSDDVGQEWSMCFSDCDLTNDLSMDKFQENLMNCLFRFPAIFSVVFVNCQSSETSMNFISLFRNFPSSIIWCTFDNVLSKNEIAELATLLPLKQGLTGLAIRNHNLKWNDMLPMIRSLGSMHSRIGFSCSLRRLDLSGNDLRDNGCAKVIEQVMQQGSPIQYLDLSRNNIGSNAKEFIDTLFANTEDDHGVSIHLTELHLAKNGLGSACATRLLRELSKQKRLALRTLNLDDNQIRKRSFDEALVSLLSRDTGILEMHLAANCLSEECGKDLRFVVGASKLHILVLTGNSDIRSIDKSDIERSLNLNRKQWRSQHARTNDESVESAIDIISDISTSPTPRLSVLFSVPLVFKDQKGILHPIQKVDYESEKEIIWQTFVESSRDIDLSFGFATTDRLRSEVTKRCRVIHYSGHGSSQCLMFEDERGGAQAVSAESLTHLVSGDTDTVQLVIVSACYSEYTGNAFVEAGVPHVVCVRVNDRILDKAAQAFTRAFYLSLTVGDSVVTAFNIARRAVDASPVLQAIRTANESAGGLISDKFLLLPQDANHDERIFLKRSILPQWPLSKFMCEIDSEKNKQKLRGDLWRGGHVPSTNEDFMGRQVECYLCLAAVSTRRLVALTGPAGIGKTALAVATANYAGERQMFRDGMLFLRCDEITTLSEVVKLICDRTPNESACSSEEVRLERLYEALRVRSCIVIFDHCDGLLDSNMKFEHFIGRLLDESRGVRVLFTSRSPPGRVSGYGVTVQTVKPLPARESAQLFLRLSSQTQSMSPVSILPGEYDFFDALAEHPSIQKLEGVPRALCDFSYSIEDREFQKIIWQCQTVMANIKSVSKSNSFHSS